MADNKLMSSYVDPVRKVMKNGNVVGVVVGIKDYKIIQENKGIKEAYEALLRNHPELSFIFNPNMSMNSQKITMSKIGKPGSRKAKDNEWFENGVPLSGFDAPLNDLTQMFYEKYGTN